METTAIEQRESLAHELGTLEGFNHRDGGAISRTLSAQEVLDWNHDGRGEAEFWPAGDHDGVALVFRAADSVTPCEIAALGVLLEHVGDDSPETFVRIHAAMSVHGESLWKLTSDQVETRCLGLLRL